MGSTKFKSLDSPQCALAMLLADGILQMNYQKEANRLLQIFHASMRARRANFVQQIQPYEFRTQKDSHHQLMQMEHFIELISEYTQIEKVKLKALYAYVDCEGRAGLTDVAFVSGILAASPLTPHIYSSEALRSYAPLSKCVKTVTEEMTGFPPMTLMRLRMIYHEADIDHDRLLNASELSRLLRQVFLAICDRKLRHKSAECSTKRAIYASSLETPLGLVFWQIVRQTIISNADMASSEDHPHSACTDLDGNNPSGHTTSEACSQDQKYAFDYSQPQLNCSAFFGTSHQPFSPQSLAEPDAHRINPISDILVPTAQLLKRFLKGSVQSFLSEESNPSHLQDLRRDSPSANQAIRSTSVQPDSKLPSPPKRYHTFSGPHGRVDSITGFPEDAKSSALLGYTHEACQMVSVNTNQTPLNQISHPQPSASKKTLSSPSDVSILSYEIPSSGAFSDAKGANVILSNTSNICRPPCDPVGSKINPKTNVSISEPRVSRSPVSIQHIKSTFQQNFLKHLQERHHSADSSFTGSNCNSSSSSPQRSISKNWFTSVGSSFTASALVPPKSRSRLIRKSQPAMGRRPERQASLVATNSSTLNDVTHPFLARTSDENVDAVMQKRNAFAPPSISHRSEDSSLCMPDVNLMRGREVQKFNLNSLHSSVFTEPQKPPSRLHRTNAEAMVAFPQTWTAFPRCHSPSSINSESPQAKFHYKCWSLDEERLSQTEPDDTARFMDASAHFTKGVPTPRFYAGIASAASHGSSSICSNLDQPFYHPADISKNSHLRHTNDSSQVLERHLASLGHCGEENGGQNAHQRQCDAASSLSTLMRQLHVERSQSDSGCESLTHVSLDSSVPSGFCSLDHQCTAPMNRGSCCYSVEPSHCVVCDAESHDPTSQTFSFLNEFQSRNRHHSGLLRTTTRGGSSAGRLLRPIGSPRLVDKATVQLYVNPRVETSTAASVDSCQSLADKLRCTSQKSTTNDTIPSMQALSIDVLHQWKQYDVSDWIAKRLIEMYGRNCDRLINSKSTLGLDFGTFAEAAKNNDIPCLALLFRLEKDFLASYLSHSRQLQDGTPCDVLLHETCLQSSLTASSTSSNPLLPEYIKDCSKRLPAPSERHLLFNESCTQLPKLEDAEKEQVESDAQLSIASTEIRSGGTRTDVQSKKVEVYPVDASLSGLSYNSCMSVNHASEKSEVSHFATGSEAYLRDCEDPQNSSRKALKTNSLDDLFQLDQLGIESSSCPSKLSLRDSSKFPAYLCQSLKDSSNLSAEVLNPEHLERSDLQDMHPSPISHKSRSSPMGLMKDALWKNPVVLDPFRSPTLIIPEDPKPHFKVVHRPFCRPQAGTQSSTSRPTSLLESEFRRTTLLRSEERKCKNQMLDKLAFPVNGTGPELDAKTPETPFPNLYSPVLLQPSEIVSRSHMALKSSKTKTPPATGVSGYLTDRIVNAYCCPSTSAMSLPISTSDSIADYRCMSPREAECRLARKVIASIKTLNLRGWVIPQATSTLTCQPESARDLRIAHLNSTRFLSLESCRRLCDNVVRILKSQLHQSNSPIYDLGRVSQPVCVLTHLFTAQLESPSPGKRQLNRVAEHFTQGTQDEDHFFESTLRSLDALHPPDLQLASESTQLNFARDKPYLILTGVNLFPCLTIAQFEYILLVFAMKILYPSRFIILRGPFDDYCTGKILGIETEVISRYGLEKGQELTRRLFDVLEFLPLGLSCALSRSSSSRDEPGKRILCLTGHLPSEGLNCFERWRHSTENPSSIYPIRSLLSHLLVEGASSQSNPIAEDSDLAYFECVWSESQLRQFESFFRLQFGTSFFPESFLHHRRFQKRSVETFLQQSSYDLFIRPESRTTNEYSVDNLVVRTSHLKSTQVVATTSFGGLMVVRVQ